jgi:hypothetical protein
LRQQQPLCSHLRLLRVQATSGRRRACHASPASHPQAITGRRNLAHHQASSRS